MEPGERDEEDAPLFKKSDLRLFHFVCRLARDRRLIKNVTDWCHHQTVEIQIAARKSTALPSHQTTTPAPSSSSSPQRSNPTQHTPPFTTTTTTTTTTTMIMRSLHLSSSSNRRLLLPFCLLLWLRCGPFGSLFLLVAGQQQQQDTDRLSFGTMELQMSSTSVSETNALLRSILSATVTFLDKSFFAAKDQVFRNVACSIVSYRLGGGGAPNGGNNSNSSNENNMLFYANVTIGGFVHFTIDSGVDQTQVLDLATAAFNNGYVETLRSSKEAFLQNLQSITIRLNGKTLLDGDDDDDESNLGSNNNIQNDSNQEQQDDKKPSKNRLPVWIVATIAGGASFMVVICIAFACVCCLPGKGGRKKHNSNTDRNKRKHAINHNNNSGSNKKKNKQKKRSLGVVTAGGTDPTDDEEFLDDEKTPSPARSLMSQDSSVFTYNPKSATNKFATARSDVESNDADDDTLSPKNNPWPVSLSSSHRVVLHHQGRSKDLSLIEEGSENSSEQSTPRGKLPQLESIGAGNNLTSLLQGSPLSTGPGYDFEGAGPVTFNPLTEKSIRELEWAADRSIRPFHVEFDGENCSPFQKFQAIAANGAFPVCVADQRDDDDEGFFAPTTMTTRASAVMTVKSYDDRARNVPVDDDDDDDDDNIDAKDGDDVHNGDHVTWDFHDLRNHINRFRGASM